MACGSCGGNSPQFDYEVTVGGSVVAVVASRTEARVKVQAAGKGGTFRAIPKGSVPLKD
jgi:hypothetical protein